ncbi:MAG: 4-hydroxy-3-methylbut-2-enyl diphosphate reductase, partial [Chloroflexi bacterium]|nr:4-hydroxy-3-methylbut-2-enyl diphosphate reductase [Chloroflexota bacterium]
MPHTLLLAEPRGFCAGVVRAIDVLDAVLDREPPPVYAFRARGAIFVDDVAEVPEGSRIVFSAHGVSPAVVEEAERRRLRVIDTTCPLVTKVHLETKNAVKLGYD